MTVQELAQVVLLRAAGTVPEWRQPAIGGLLIVIAFCLFVVLWLFLPEDAS